MCVAATSPLPGETAVEAGAGHGESREAASAESFGS